MQREERNITIVNGTDEEIEYVLVSEAPMSPDELDAAVSRFTVNDADAERADELGQRNFYAEGEAAYEAARPLLPPADVIEAGEDAVADWNDGYTTAEFAYGPRLTQTDEDVA